MKSLVDAFLGLFHAKHQIHMPTVFQIVELKEGVSLGQRDIFGAQRTTQSTSTP